MKGGDIDANVPWHFEFGTLFNKTTDVLRIDPADIHMPGGGFLTDGPSLQYALDFILNYKFIFDLDYDVPVLPRGDLISLSEQDNLTENIIDYDSDTSSPISLNFWNNALTATLAWPNLQVAGTETAPGSGVYKGKDESNNAFNLNLDVDQAIANLFFGGKNPFDVSIEVSLVDLGGGVNVQLIDADVAGGLNFLQDFLLDAGNINAVWALENGSTVPFVFGTPTTIQHASTIDTDHDNKVEGDVSLDLVDSTLKNKTDLGLNVGWSFDIVKGSWWYDALVDADSVSIGPLVHYGEDRMPVFDTNLFSDTIGVSFGPESMSLYA